MGWTAGEHDRPFTSKVAIAFELGDEFASRVIDTARYGTVIYAAVGLEDGAQVFGLVLLAERSEGILYTKPVSEDMGPAEDCCPERILKLLSEPSNEHAREWRGRCRARIRRGLLRPGQVVHFAEALKFLDGTERRRLAYVSGSRFRAGDGPLYHVASWWTLDYELEETSEPEGSDHPSTTHTPEERRRAEVADARGDFDSLESRIGRLGYARDATAQSLEELRERPDARHGDIRLREEQLSAYDAELAELRSGGRL